MDINKIPTRTYRSNSKRLVFVIVNDLMLCFQSHLDLGT